MDDVCDLTQGQSAVAALLAEPLSSADEAAINQEIEEYWQQQQQLQGEQQQQQPLQLPAAGTKMLPEGDILLTCDV